MRRSTKTEMTASSFNIIFAFYLSFIFHQSHGFEVIQPRTRTVNPDGVASIRCEFVEEVNSVEDVRLTRISPTDNERTLLCQKGNKDCQNIFMHQENPQNPKKWLFILWNIGPKDVNMTYECEITVNDKNDLHKTAAGKPTTLLQGQQETEEDCAPHSTLPPALLSDQLRWILIGLLTLMFLCICVIVCTCVRLRFQKSEAELENGTYVEMRKAPLPRNPPVGVYCGNC